MASDKRRRQIAWEAARLLCYREESEYHRAKWRAALRRGAGALRPLDLPATREIRQEAARIAHSLERDSGPGPSTGRSHREELSPDRFRVYETLLLPLEQVKEDRRTHPEGDVLYHSLQVFDLARRHLPYDEEFLLAALLHDVGKAVDPKEHVGAALDSLCDTVTERTAWLIEHHVEALSVRDGRLGARSLRRLEASESFGELMLLAECDRKGRVKGAPAPDLTEALDYVRQLAQEDEQEW